MNYQYVAKSPAGEDLRGMLSAASLAEARQRLRERRLFVVSLIEAGAAGGASRGRGRIGRVSKRDLLTLTSQLAIMCRAGVDLATALENVTSRCNSPALKQALQQVHHGVLAGKSVSAAMGDCEFIFGKSYIAGIAAAEAAGRLPDVLDRLAALLQSELRMRSTLRTLLAYPILLTGISLVITFALMFLVLPQFSQVFEQLEVPLPIATQLLVSVARELRERIWLWGTLGAGLMTGLAVFLYSEKGRHWCDRLMLSVVMVRDIVRALSVGRAFRLLGTLQESGVPLLDGLRLTRASVRNRLIKGLFDDLEREVLSGRGLGPTFLTSPLVPPGAAQMIATAERTGTLASVTQLVGTFYEEEGETKLRDLATILEPLIIVGMGVIVAFIVMAVMLPVFEFATAGH